jgi:hypothetical protein
MIVAVGAWSRESRDGWQHWIDLYRRLNVSISALNTSWFIASLVFCMGIATPSHAQAIQPVPPTPIDVKKGELGGTPWDPQWDEMIEKALPPEMFSSGPPGRPSILPAILRDGRN